MGDGLVPYHPEKLTHPSQAKTVASSTTEVPWDPIYLNPQHVEMIKQRVQGIPVSRIVYNFKRFGVQFSGRHIKRVIDSPKGREFASLYSAQLHAGTVGLTTAGAMYAPEALYVEVDIMRNPLSGERHRLSAAQDLMDRTGPVKVSRQETENLKPTQIIITLSASQLSQFAAPPAAIEATVVPLLLENPSSNDDGS